MILNSRYAQAAMLLSVLFVGTVGGCGSQSKDAVKPETFAPPPPGDSPTGEKGPAKPTESAEG